jgi:hypothetical protein
MMHYMQDKTRSPLAAFLLFWLACSPHTAETDASPATSTESATSEPTVSGTSATTSEPTESGTSATTSESTTGAPLVCGGTGVSQTLINEDGQRSFKHAIAGAGDVDADGFPDVIIGAVGDVLEDPTVTGRAYVVFRPSVHEEITLGDHEGLTIVGEVPGHMAGLEVGRVGDVNGDGFADVAVNAATICQPVDDGCLDDGCPVACSEGPERSYIVHGRAEPGTIELADVASGIGGFTIEHQFYPTFIPLGDLNGDSLADFAVAESYGVNGFGRVHVVFGKKDTQPVAWYQIESGKGGYEIRGENAYDNLGFAARAAGDVDGDGRQDLVLGAPYAEMNLGRAYVVFGKATTTPVLLSDVAAGKGGGFAIFGDEDGGSGLETGHAAAPAGDIDGDGLADVAVSTYNYGNGSSGGRAYIVLGKSDAAPVQLTGFSAGVVIKKAGSSTMGLDGDGTDLDGNGLPDLLVGIWGDTARVQGAAPGTTVVMGDDHAPWLHMEGWETLLPVLGDLDCDGRSDLGYFYRPNVRQIRLDYVFGG